MWYKGGVRILVDFFNICEIFVLVLLVVIDLGNNYFSGF